MAGLGLGPPDFALFEIDEPDDRAAALEATLEPKLSTLGAQCVQGLGARRRQGAVRPPRQAPPPQGPGAGGGARRLLRQRRRATAARPTSAWW